MKFPVCTLSRIISPGNYSVISNDKEHVSEVMDLEEKMWMEICLSDTSEYQLNHQMCVAVIDSNRKFKRGIIENRITEDLYEVLLMDYGEVIHVERSKLKVILNENFMKVEPLAFIVKLYGLIPTRYIPVGAVRKPRACKNWSPECKIFVENLFKENHKVVVKSIFIEQGVVYGDLFIQLKPNMKFVSLRKILCRNEFCAYSESVFLEQEGFNPSNESLQLATKMEFVKKWQKENFGQFKESFQSDTSVSSSKPAKTEAFSPVLSTSESVSASVKESNKILVRNEKIPKAVPVEHKGIGLGRGKIKLLIEEMKKKEEALKPNNGISLQSDFSASGLVSETKVSLGRGQLLKKYLRIKKLDSDRTQSSGSRTETNSREINSDRYSNAEKESDDPGILSVKAIPKMERAVIKPGHFAELSNSDSNELTEVSLSVEDEPPPLVPSRNLKIEKVFGREDEAEFSYGAERNQRDSEADSRVENWWHSRRNRIFPEHWHWSSREANVCWSPYVVFDDFVVEPVETFKELPIKRSVVKNLEKGGTFDHLSQVQRWAIPAIRKQLNTIVVGSSKTGKTMSYIVPLMDYVQDESYFEELPQGNGPFVVIVASSSRVCESIHDLCQSLLGQSNESLRTKVKVLLVHGGGREREVWVSLTNGCDILISTPHCLVRLLEWSVLTNFERLTCLVLDEIDVISQNPFRKHTRVILEKAEFSTKNRHCQKIFCGEKWTPSVESLAKTYVKSYALVIGSYSEAVTYGGIKPSMYLVDQQQKPEVLLVKLKDLVNSRVLVVCEEASEAVRLCGFLGEKGISCLLAHEDMLADKLKEIGEMWKSSNCVLITTDEVLKELDVREAQVLVHFGLPCKSKTKFFLRYWSLGSFLGDKINFSKSKNKAQNGRIQDIILIDDANHYQLPHIVDLVMRLGGKISTKIQEKCQEIRRKIEVQKLDSPVCGNLLAFGRCRDQTTCPQRHAFLKEFDSPQNLPTSGWVSFLVLRTHDASCFSVRLVEHTHPRGETTKLNDRCLELPLKLSEFFKKETNRRPHGVPVVGNVCAVKSQVLQQDVFYRAKVIEYLKFDKYDKPLEVRVKLIDRGDVWKRKNIELYELPEDLSKDPPTAVDVRIVGLQPMDFDVSWSQIANNFTEHLMSQKLEENQYWSGRIVLALKDTLYLDPVRRKEFLPHLNTHVFDLTVHDELLNNKIAVANTTHLPALIKLCSDGGIEVPRTEDETKESAVMIRPQWAFFDTDFVEVKFSAAESTSTVFLQPKKFEKQLLEFEEDCQKEGAKARSEAVALKAGKSNSPVRVGMFCLALYEDGKWNRGRVESENENQFQVFFVDHGDFLSVFSDDVVPIPQALLLRLPCQAIECRLAGIEDKEDCPLEVLKKMYEFSDDGREELYASVIRNDLKPNFTHGRKYSLNLVNKRGVSLNKMLVECGVVGEEETERKYLENIEMVESDGESEGDLNEGSEEVGEETGLDLNPSDDFSISFNDGVFEDEAAQEFLKEFASRMSNLFESVQENKPNEKEETPPEEAGRKRGNQDVRRLLELSQKRRRKVKKLELIGREKVLTPQLAWCQNQMEIHIKILLGDVKDLSLECSVNNLSFRCFSADKFYAFDLKMYGAVNPRMTKVIPKTFHVLVVLAKLTFPLWPRLQMDKGKLRWITLDVESLSDKEGAFSEKVRSAKIQIQSGMVKSGRRNEKVFPCSDSEISDSEVETDSEDEECE